MRDTVPAPRFFLCQLKVGDCRPRPELSLSTSPPSSNQPTIENQLAIEGSFTVCGRAMLYWIEVGEKRATEVSVSDLRK